MEQLSFIKEPVMEFQSQEQLQSCIEEWKKILFLEDWTIKGVLKERPLLDEDGDELSGSNNFQIVNRSSVITIVIPDDDTRSRVAKYCAEETLVHELLHCKYNWIHRDMDSIEVAYFDTLEHSLIEQMAKSLIMVKYNLPFKWFQNF